MTTLHIEHPVTDYDLWKRAFDGFAERRVAAGVRSHVVRRPVDDDHYVVLDLEFDAAGAAEAFLGFLRNQVWSTPSNSPALAGAPVTRVLETTESRGDGAG